MHGTRNLSSRFVRGGSMAVTDDEIKDRAYKIWQLWGMPNDLGEVIWQQARRELEFQEQVERLKLVHRYSKA
jgi:hypothetical protein